MVGMPVDSNLIKRAKRNPILLKQNRRSSFALEQEAEHLGEGAAVWEWIRTLGGSGTPESCPRWGTAWLGAPEPRLRRALRAYATAERGREIVHGEAVGAELVRGGEMLANVAGGNRRSVGEAREDEQAGGGELARIFRRGIVTRRQALQQLRIEVGVAEKAIGVRELPEPARRVELDVMANGAQHRGGEGELDIGAAVEAGETLNCRGIWRPRTLPLVGIGLVGRPRTLPMVVGPALLDGGHQYVAEDSWQDGVSAENKDIFMNSTLKDALKKWAERRGLD